MDYSPEELARLRLEEEFGAHAREVLNAGAMPNVAPYALQLRLQEAVPSKPQGWRPEYGDPDKYLQSVYFCQQQ
jgi:hypothetical protein